MLDACWACSPMMGPQLTWIQDGFWKRMSLVYSYFYEAPSLMLCVKVMLAFNNACHFSIDVTYNM